MIRDRVFKVEFSEADDEWVAFDELRPSFAYYATTPFVALYGLIQVMAEIEEEFGNV